MSFSTETIDNWNRIHDFARLGWMFRGQRSSAWELQTSLERCFNREGVAASERPWVEAELLREFKRSYHQYTQHVPKSGNILEWLSLMQHHGAPTRLLDFSYSIYIAAYFALETTDEASAVWAVNGPWALKESVSALKRAKKRNTKRLQEPFQENQESVLFPMLFEPPYAKTAVPLNPYRLNERLRIQKGVFLLPGDPSSCFMEHLQSLSGYENDAHIVKLIIPFSIRSEALKSLHSMNISSTSLFPGIDGFAKSLGVYHPAFQPVPWV
jgi:FRG domain